MHDFLLTMTRRHAVSPWARLRLEQTGVMQPAGDWTVVRKSLVAVTRRVRLAGNRQGCPSCVASCPLLQVVRLAYSKDGG